VRARAGAGSRRIVLRWGARVLGGLRRRGEGAVVWCLLTPSFRAAARKRVLGRFQEVFSRSNHGISKQGAREPSPNLSPPGSLAQAKLTVPFWCYRPATAHTTARRSIRLLCLSLSLSRVFRPPCVCLWQALPMLPMMWARPLCTPINLLQSYGVPGARVTQPAASGLTAAGARNRLQCLCCWLPVSADCGSSSSASRTTRHNFSLCHGDA